MKKIIVLHEEENKLFIVDEKTGKLYEICREKDNSAFGDYLILNERILDGITTGKIDSK